MLDGYVMHHNSQHEFSITLSKMARSGIDCMYVLNRNEKKNGNDVCISTLMIFGRKLFFTQNPARHVCARGWWKTLQQDQVLRRVTRVHAISSSLLSFYTAECKGTWGCSVAFQRWTYLFNMLLLVRGRAYREPVHDTKGDFA